MKDDEWTTPAERAATKGRRRFRWKRWLTVLGVLLVLLVVGAELFARYYLGLGDPPLMVEDPEIEYLFKPSMRYSRFGNHIAYNAYSMRSGPLTLKKSSPDELRVMVIGDSVINGGSMTDDSQLATTLLHQRLSAATGRKVYVGNISAGSWGPPNELAYIKRFGWFDADVAVIVVSSSDYRDVPTFEHVVGMKSDMPDHAPMFALQEAIGRYIRPMAEHDSTVNPGTVYETAPPSQDDVKVCHDAMIEIVRSARAAGIKTVIVAQHVQANEQLAIEAIGHKSLMETSIEAGAQTVQLDTAFMMAMLDGKHPYRDYIHPNALGQKLIADALFGPILTGLKIAMDDKKSVGPTTKP